MSGCPRRVLRVSPGTSLFHHHVFIDLETTGLNPQQDDIIEIGAIFVHQGKIVEKFSQLFRASGPLSPAIRLLTGLSDADLENHQPVEEFFPELEQRLQGWTVVAHNAAFERAFLSVVLEKVEAPILDSCELMHYLYPELRSHALDNLIRWANQGTGSSHRALQDCEDTFAVVGHALDACIAQKRFKEVEEIVTCLHHRSSASLPILQLLSQLFFLCRAQSPSASVPSDSPQYAERAAQAYVQAFFRKRPEAVPEDLSYWFKNRFPVDGTFFQNPALRLVPQLTAD